MLRPCYDLAHSFDDLVMTWPIQRERKVILSLRAKSIQGHYKVTTRSHDLVVTLPASMTLPAVSMALFWPLPALEVKSNQERARSLQAPARSPQGPPQGHHKAHHKVTKRPPPPPPPQSHYKVPPKVTTLQGHPQGKKPPRPPTP